MHPHSPLTGAIIPAAGIGSRMEADKPKQFLMLAGEPVLIRTCRPFLDNKAIDVVVLPLPPDHISTTGALLQQHLPQHLFNKIILTAGGATRQDSVKAGLDRLPDSIELVLVHDGARPLVEPGLISRCIEEARQYGAVITAIEVKDTIKEVGADEIIHKTIDRKGLWQAQTPQAAKKDLLIKAYDLATKSKFTGTDEASLFEFANIPVRVIAGSERNLKITRPGDMHLAESLLRKESTMKIGHGFDAHRLVTERKLILGGVAIEFELGLAGHSDADVLTHALTDAILGALGAGDIGRHFPDNDPAFKNISSLLLLEQVMKLVREKQYQLGNADITVICQLPKLAPHLDAMRDNLAHCCKVGVDAINIKATTTEKMGYPGRGEGIAAHAVVILRSAHGRE